VQFVDGVLVEDKGPFRSRGEKGVFLAQLNVLRDAAAAGESLLILEDDVDFTPAALSWHRSPDCDFAYGGYEATDKASPETSGIVGAHCMGFSARAIAALVPFLEDLLEHESPPPIDGAYVWFRRQHPEFRTEFADPVIAVQRPSRSDITPRRAFDRIPVIRSAAGAARGIKRQVQRGAWTFGLREAIILSIVGIAIGSAVAYYHVG
jgi:glycosyl transferase family 25